MARIDYDAIARSYDAGRDLALDGLTAWRDALSAWLPPVAGLPIVDVGAGTGRFSLALAEWFSCPVVALEPSAGMRGEARRKFAGHDIHPVAARAEFLPLAAESAGAVWLSNVIHHVDDLGAVARELRRVLVPGAPVLIRSAFPGRTDGIDLYRYFPAGERVLNTFPVVEETVAAFEAAGFGYESLRGIPQVTAPSLAAYRDRVRHRADTTLQLISDKEFSAGLEALDRAVEQEREPRPVINYLDLLVLS